MKLLIPLRKHLLLLKSLVTQLFYVRRIPWAAPAAASFVWLVAPWLGIEMPFVLALLLASTMSSTDSASVFSILRSKKQGLKQNLRPLLELLDTPGILWPRFDDPEVGKRLAFTGAIKDDVVDMEELACYLMDYLGRRYAPVLEERYKIDVQPEDSGYDLLEKAGRKRGFLMRGAQVDTQRMARVLLDEFRGGKLGRFTLETVEDAQ